MTVPCLQDLSDQDAIAGHLVSGGMSREAAAKKGGFFAASAEALLKAGVSGQRAVRACFVPGRIEVLGKHTDYAGGRSMVVAAERGICLIAAGREDAAVAMLDAARGTRADFMIEPDLVPMPAHWSNYPMSVARRVARNFPGSRRGADIAFASDLPPAAGMSSSSALIVATFLALAGVNGLTRHPQYGDHIRDREDLAGYLGTVENGQSFGALAGDRGVGTFGGSEDHTAILCGRPDRISQYSYCPVRFERFVTLPPDHLIAIGVSGVVAEKTGSAMEDFNRLSRLAGAVIELWRAATGRDDPHLAAAIASSPDAPDRLTQILGDARHGSFAPAELLDRFGQFLEESERIIPAVPDVLDESSLARFGELVDRSQSRGVGRLRNQVPETVHPAATARRFGAAAASAFGAGFGGSVWALVGRERVEPFLDEWAADYVQAFPERTDDAGFFTVRAGPSAIEWG